MLQGTQIRLHKLTSITEAAQAKLQNKYIPGRSNTTRANYLVILCEFIICKVTDRNVALPGPRVGPENLGCGSPGTSPGMWESREYSVLGNISKHARDVGGSAIMNSHSGAPHSRIPRNNFGAALFTSLNSSFVLTWWILPFSFPSSLLFLAWFIYSSSI